MSIGNYGSSASGTIRCKICNRSFGMESIEIRISNPMCQIPALGEINNVPLLEPPAQGKIQCPYCGYEWMIHSGQSSFHER